MPRQPILPRSKADPGQVDRKERGAMKVFRSKVRQAGRAYIDLLERIDFRAVTVNATRYEFNTLPEVFAQMVDNTNDLIDQIMLEGGQNRLWFTQQYVVPAYEQGTQQAVTNLGAQSPVYAATRPNLQTVLFSEPYQRRLGLVRAREFELMKGLSAQIKSGLSQQLTAGMAQGFGPQKIAKALTEQLGIEERRALRIARTEIGQAQRTARLDETQDAQQRLGVQSLIMHVSALSPSTRLTHGERHGQIFTVEEQRNWMTVDGNACNCKCSSLELLVDDQGNPLSPKIVERVRASGRAWLEAREARLKKD